MKTNLNQGVNQDLKASLLLEAQQLIDSVGSAEAKEAIECVYEKTDAEISPVVGVKCMKYFLVLWVSLLGLQARADEVKQIEELYAQWREAVATADIPSYVSVLDPDVRLIPPGADVIEGAASLCAVFDAGV